MITKVPYKYIGITYIYILDRMDMYIELECYTKFPPIGIIDQTDLHLIRAEFWTDIWAGICNGACVDKDELKSHIVTQLVVFFTESRSTFFYNIKVIQLRILLTETYIYSHNKVVWRRDLLQMAVVLVRKSFHNSYLQNLHYIQIGWWVIDIYYSPCTKSDLTACPLQINKVEGHLLGFIVNGSPNSFVKKSCVGILHIFTHIPTHPLFSKYLQPHKTIWYFPQL